MNVLISGGTGLVGSRLAALLADTDHDVALLSRMSHHTPGRGAGATPPRAFRWDPAAGTVDPAAVPWSDTIVNLAGANVGEGRWTDARKQELRASRIDSLALLHRELARSGHRVRAVVSASAVSLYGDTGDAVVTEATPPATHDFLAELTAEWERAVAPIAALGIRVVTPRIGVVLSAAGGALPAMAAPVKLGLGSALGSGRQYLPWIHIDDRCHLIIAMLTDAAWQGAYNAVAPHPVTNAAFTRALADVLHRPLLLPRVPAIALTLAMGEQSTMALTGTRASAATVIAQGFTFTYPELRTALQALYATYPRRRRRRWCVPCPLHNPEGRSTYEPPRLITGPEHPGCVHGGRRGATVRGDGRGERAVRPRSRATQWRTASSSCVHLVGRRRADPSVANR